MSSSHRPVLRRASALVGVLLALAACGEGGLPFVDPIPPTPHERYAHALSRAGLDSTALGRDWFGAARAALAFPTAVALPYREAGYFAPDEARALAWRVRLRRGERLVADVSIEGGPLQLFADLYEVPRDTTGELEHRAHADSAAVSLSHEARRDAEYVLRLQPELLRSARFTLELRIEPSLAFPVEGRDSRAVRSYFGAQRDAGRRSHHGIDIFAPRGTPVVAATEGLVRSTRPNELGGIVVWLSDARRGQSLYYAHLDGITVQEGQAVRVGDTLGFVGNTGNARTTPPHLHFGIYRRGEGPVDPYPFIHRPGGEAAEVVASADRFGRLARTGRGATILRRAPHARADTLLRIAAATPVRVDGGSGAWLRVRLPDGSAGWLATASTAPAEPMRRAALRTGLPVRERPDALAPTVTTTTGEPLPVLGTWASYALVETASGRRGWVTLGDSGPNE